MNVHGLWVLFFAFVTAASLRAEEARNRPQLLSLSNSSPPVREGEVRGSDRAGGTEFRVASLWGQSPPATTAQQTPHPAIVRVIAVDRNSMSLGSGSLVDSNEQYGLVVTNWHVVRDAVGPIEVVFPDGFHSLAQVVRTDKEWDLAALLIWKPPVQPLPISSTAPRPGDPLSIAGYGSGNYLMQAGRCEEYLSPAPGRPQEIVEVSAAARHGDSGGPILNSRGEIAGVLFGQGGGHTDGSYCGRLQKFLQQAAVDLQRLPPTNIAANARPPIAGQVTQNIARGPGPPAFNSARFEGGIVAANPPGPAASGSCPTADWMETPSPRIAERAAATGNALAMAAPNESTGLGKVGIHESSAWSWRNELKSVLAAFGIAAILLQFLQGAAPKRRTAGR